MKLFSKLLLFYAQITEKDYLLTATNKILKSESIPCIYHIKNEKGIRKYVYEKTNYAIALIMYITILGTMIVTKTANMIKLVQNVTKVSIHYMFVKRNQIQL